jgi:hypothetical protein
MDTDGGAGQAKLDAAASGASPSGISGLPSGRSRATHVPHVADWRWRWRYTLTPLELEERPMSN